MSREALAGCRVAQAIVFATLALWVACLRAHPPARPTTLPMQRDKWDAIIRGVFAGNIFDLGTKHTTEMYHEARAARRHAVC